MPLPKISTPSYELELPSTGETVNYRPFLVKEEKLLLLALESEDVKQVTTAVKNVIKNCVLSKGVKVETLPTFDIEYLFLNIRAKSVGEELEFSITCPDDGETQVEVTIDIDAIKVHKDDKHDSVIDLGNGYFVKMKYPTMKYIADKKNIETKSVIDSTFDYAVDCIEQIYNDEEVWEAANSTRKELVEFVESLNSKQYQKIQDFFNTMPKLKHTVKITNPKTGVESDVTIEGLANFFA